MKEILGRSFNTLHLLKEEPDDLLPHTRQVSNALGPVRVIDK